MAVQKTSNLYHPDFVEGRPAFFDVSVRDSLQPSHIIHVISNPESAAEAGAEEKDMKHGAEVLKSGYSFIPLVVESLGYWAKSSLETLKIIASRSATVYNTTLSIAVN